MIENHDPRAELIGAYVLDALTPEETEAFEDHLAECEVCRREVHELRRVTTVLPLGVEQVEPPPGLRDRILAEIRDEVTGAPVVDLGAERKRRYLLREPAAWAGLVAAVLILGLGIWNVRLMQQVHNQQDALSFNRTVAGAIATGASVSRLAGTSAAPASAAALVQPRHGRAYVIVHDLPPRPNNRVYEVWLVQRGKPQDAGVFALSGRGTQVWQLAISARGYVAAAMTLEPGPRGSTQPTTQQLVAGRLVA